MFENEYDIHSLQKVIPTGQNFEMLITPRYLEHYVNHIYEPLTTRIISTNLTKGGIFVDIGAHYGFYSLLAGNISQVSRILAFEPAPINFQILKQNIELNNLKNVELLNFAVSDATDVRQFKIVEASDSCGFYDHPNLTTIEEIEVNTVTLDSIFRDPIEVDLLVKINAEGHELNILDGMENLIKNSLPKLKLIVEYNPKLLEGAKRKPGELVSRLFALGFQVFIINEKDGIIKKISPEQVRNDYEELTELKQPTDYVNLLCVPTEQALSIVFFSHSADIGGAEECLLTYVTGLIHKGAECTIILPSVGKLKTNLEKVGAFTLVFPYDWWADINRVNSQLLNERLGNQFSVIWNEILPTLRRINPDVIVTNTTVIPWGAICAFLMNKPHIWYVQEFGGADHELQYFYPHQIVSKYIEGSSNIVVTNSNATKKYFFGETRRDNIKTIYLPVDYDLVKNLSSENHKYFKYDDSIKLALVGRIQAGKGQIDAVDAVKELVSTGKKVELILAGTFDAEYMKSLRELIQLYNLQPFIYIFDFLDNPYPLFKQADVVLVCSRNEAFGLVTLEAMSLGKPVIGTNSGGTPEIIQDGDTGLLYTPGDYRELANKILELIEHPEKRNQIGLEAAQHVSKHFQKDSSITKFLNILHSQKQLTNHSSHVFISWVIGLIKNYLNNLSAEIDRQSLASENINTSLQAQVERLQAQLGEKDHQISNIKAQLGERDHQISNIKAQLGEKDHQISNIKAQLGERDHQISNINAQLGERDHQISSIKAQLEEKDSLMSSLQKKITVKEQQSTSLQEQIMNLEERVRGLSAQFIDFEQQTSTLYSQKNNLELELTSIQDQLKQREQILQGLNSTLLDIYSSTAWKIIQFMWKVRLWLAPHGSKREIYLKKLYSSLFILLSSQRNKRTQVNMRSINDSKSAEKEGDFDQNIGVVQIERESERFRREAFERFILELASRVDDSRKVSHMIALPFLLTGGAEFVALNYSRAILENNPDSLVLLVVTDKGKISNKIQIPEHVILINLEDYICVNDYASKQDLLYDIINSIRPDVVHNINSEVAWFLILNQGEILTKFTNLYACIFAFQYDSDRKKIGYAANFLEKGLPFLSGLMTDNHRFIEDAIRTYPLIKEQATKLRVIYNPSRAAQGSTLKQVNERISSYSDRVKAGKNLNAIWAGRIDQEKRIDLFRDLVRISDFVNYDVYGNVVVDEIEKEFPNLDNLIYYGGFEDVNPIFSSKIYDVFIFTSKWEGMPNILIEAGSWGIPIIAPSVGGVSELINKDTGYLLPQNPTPYDYLRSLKAIKDNPTEAATKATNLLNLISRRHNWSAFFESVKDIPGYLCR